MVSIKQPRYQEETSFEFGLPSIIAHFPKEHHYSFSSLYLSSAKRYTGWWENVCKNAFSCHRTACFPPHNILIIFKNGIPHIEVVHASQACIVCALEAREHTLCAPSTILLQNRLWERMTNIRNVKNSGQKCLH